MRSSKLLVPLLAIALSSSALAADKSVAIVNGTPISQSDLDTLAKETISNSGGHMQDSPELRANLKQQLITRQIILQEAARRNLEKTAQFKERLEDLKGALLQRMLFDDIAKQNPISDAQVKAEYDRLKTQAMGQKEVHARQIVLSSEDEAQQVINQLKKGAKFEALAREKSKDPNAKQSGGDMGWGNLAMMPKPLSEALGALGKGKISQTPYKSDLGYHVFKIEDIRDAVFPSYDEAKTQLAAQMQNAAIERTVADLRSKAKIQ